MTATIAVEVVYAERDRQTVVALELPAGSTVADAIGRAGLNALHPALPAEHAVGIWGRLVPVSTPLQAGDRVELYRPLPEDPKVTRRKLARQGRTMGRARDTAGR